MTAPMMLPWLARKWGVSDERAQALWNLACVEAEVLTGERNTSRYWGQAKALLIDHLDGDIIASCPVLETPWIMMRLNVLRLFATARFWFDYSRRTFA